MAHTHRNTLTSRRSRKIITTIGVLLSVGILGPLPCRSAPSFIRKPAWENIEETDVLSGIANCDPVSGRCWGFLPILETRSNDDEMAALQQEPDLNRVQILRTRNVDQTPADSWQSNQMGSNRLSKDKDMSKLTAGGMPFSVLYTGPQGRMTLPSGSGGLRGEPAKFVDKPSASSLVSSGGGKTLQGTSRLATRNGGFSSLRRNHPAIPQLFISYGWGPAGK